MPSSGTINILQSSYHFLLFCYYEEAASLRWTYSSTNILTVQPLIYCGFPQQFYSYKTLRIDAVNFTLTN